MGENEATDRSDEELQKFNASTRTGRRNALTSLEADEVDTATLKLVNRLIGVTTDPTTNDSTATDDSATTSEACDGQRG
uniref:Uncharacterized protein n=1 Tax=Syphacia muris TaxID=451379 RepID=A0A0N5AN68_9BILA